MTNKHKRYLALSVMILLVFAFTISIGNSKDNLTADKPVDIFEDIKPYEGAAGPGSAFYGLKIAFENVGEAFTLNTRDKIELQLEHGRQRIAEARAELRRNNRDAANRALEQYREKVLVADSQVSGIAGNDSTLIAAQKRIVEHQLVLQRLLDDHPGVPGLARALNNSLRLEERFELKTDRKVVPLVTRERIVMEDIRREDIRGLQREETEVKAEIVGNVTEVRVKVEFVSNKTEPGEIAQEILSRFSMSRDTIDNLLEIQVAAEEDLIERLRAEARIERGISEDEAEFRFPLNTTNRTSIVDGTFRKLSALNATDILSVLEVRVRELRGIRAFEKEETEVRAEIVGNDTEVRVKVEFVSNKTDPAAIAQEILARFNLSRDMIDNLLEIQVAEQEDLVERLRAKARVGEMKEGRRGSNRGRDGGDDRGGRDDGSVRASGFWEKVDLREDEAGDDRGGRGGDDRRGRDGGREGEIRDDREGRMVAGMNFTEVEAEFRFPLFNTTTRAGIVEGTFQKLSNLTVERILQVLEFRELKQKREERREQEVSREGELPGEAERGTGRESGRGGRG